MRVTRGRPLFRWTRSCGSDFETIFDFVKEDGWKPDKWYPPRSRKGRGRNAGRSLGFFKMERKTFGLSDVLVPEIGLGTHQYRAGPGPIRAAIDHGATFIDTAEIYGTEPIVAEAIRGRRQEIFLSTKAAPRNFRRRDLISAAENSLKRLGTDYIDLYQLHWPNYLVPIAETMAAMEELVAAGKIRFIGVSNFSEREVERAQAALSKNRIVSNQVLYNLVERTIEGGLLQFCEARQIAI